MLANYSEYEICEPGRLIVTYLREGDFDPALSPSGVISVVRNVNTVSIDSELYKPAAALTKDLDVLFQQIDGPFEVTLFCCD